MVHSNLGSTVFTIGKFKGKTFREVHKTNHGYVAWALKIKDPTGQLREFCLYIKSIDPSSPEGKNGNSDGGSCSTNAAEGKPANSSTTEGSASKQPGTESSNQQQDGGSDSVVESNGKRKGESLEEKWRKITNKMNTSDDTWDEKDSDYAKCMVMPPKRPAVCIKGVPTFTKTWEASEQARKRHFGPISEPSVGRGQITSPRPVAINPLVKSQGITYPQINEGPVPLRANVLDPKISMHLRQEFTTCFNPKKQVQITTTNILKSPDSTQDGNAASSEAQKSVSVKPAGNGPIPANTVGAIAGSLLMKENVAQHVITPVEGIKVNIEGVVALVLNSDSEFHVAFQRQVSENKSVWTSTLPSSLFEYLRSLDQGLRLKRDDKHTFVVFAADKYDTILKALRKVLANCKCPVDPIPNFILATFPAFSQFAKQTKMPEKTKQGLAGEVCEYTQKNMQRIADVVGNELYMQLKPFQKEGVTFGIKKNGRVLIGDEMGLGKTLQALAIAAFYCVDWPLLIVCPSSLRFQWRDQCERWLSHLIKKDEICTIKSGKTDIPDHTKVVIISYDLYALNEHFRHGFRIVICDESHYIKNKAAKRTKSLVPLLKEARRAILLSGTPTLNSPAELYEQISGLLPDFSSNSTFVERYCEKKLHWFTKKMIYSGSKHANELHIFLVNTVMIRRLKESVLHELPPKLRSKVPIELPKTFLREYKMAMASFMSEDGLEHGAKSNLPKIQEMFRLTGEAKSKAVCEYITHLLKTEVKFIIFAHHLVVMDNIENTLKQQNCNYIRIDGSTSQAKREEYVGRFQNDPECTTALLSLTACGVGLNLTASSTVIFAELHWVPGQMIQAEDRAHRIGTKHRAININYLIAENSVEETIWRVINRKWKDVTATLNGETSNLTLLKQEETNKLKDIAMQQKIEEVLPIRKNQEDH